MKNLKLSCISLILITLFACSEGSEDARNLPLTDQDLFARNSMDGTWQFDTCYRDGDSDHFYETRFYVFRANLNRTELNNYHGNFEIHYLLYSPGDDVCVGDPIARINEVGTFNLGNEISPGIYELDLRYSNSTVYGDLFLGEPALDPYTSFPTFNYEIISHDGTSGNLLISHSYSNSSLNRPTALESDLLSIANLPANYDQYQTVPTYNAVTHNNLAGTWYSSCESESTDRRLLTYNFTPPSNLGGAGTVVYTESIHPADDSSCNNPAIASISYTGTYTIDPNPINLTYPANIAATGVDLNLTAKTGNTANPHVDLANWAVPYVKQETMAVELTRGILLNSRGEGDGTVNNPRPENLEIIYINTAR